MVSVDFRPITREYAGFPTYTPPPIYIDICTCVCMYMCMYENIRYFLVDMGLWVMLSYPFTTCSPSPSIPLPLGFIKFLGFFVKTS